MRRGMVCTMSFCAIRHMGEHSGLVSGGSLCSFGGRYMYDRSKYAVFLCAPATTPGSGQALHTTQN